MEHEKIFKKFDSRIKKDKESKIKIAREKGFKYFSQAIYDLYRNQNYSLTNIGKLFNMKVCEVDSYIIRIESSISMGSKKEKICRHCGKRKVYKNGMVEYWDSCYECCAARKKLNRGFGNPDYAGGAGLYC